MKYYQLSFPKSGANWLRHIARTLLGIKKEYLEIDIPDDIYIKTHQIPLPEYNIKDTNRSCILLLRDFKECTVRFDKHLLQCLPMYAACLQTYHDWPSPKLLIYYEDLLQNTTQEIDRLSYFLNTDSSIVHSQFNELKDESINKYNKEHGCQSNEQQHYHKYKIDIEQYNKKTKQYIPKNLLVYINRYF